MSALVINQDPKVKPKLNSYSPIIRNKIVVLRQLILDTASEIDSITEIEETLKWGEPSYITKKGSTIRIDWKSKNPDQYAIYFKCTSKLVLTFREVYGDLFSYENHRAILFKLDDKIPLEELKICIACALQYHELKDKPLLGLSK